MRYQLRWVLPVAQLLVCLVALWPARDHLLISLALAKQSRAAAQQKIGQSWEPQRVIVLPELTHERQREVDAAYEKALRGMRVPVVLNFPIVVAQVPYLLLRRREWIPQGMPSDSWRALIWPLIGTVFWFLAGRGIEALSASFQSTVYPRLHWGEVAWAVVLLVVGIVMFVGVATTTPDDRLDKNFMALLYGGLLWGVLAGLTVTARFRQWRICDSQVSG